VAGGPENTAAPQVFSLSGVSAAVYKPDVHLGRISLRKPRLLTPDRALILTFRDSHADSHEWPLMVDLGHRVAQGFVGESHEAVVGLAQFKD
jgi:hypothetical protein